MLLQHLFNTIVSCVLLTTSSYWSEPCFSTDNYEHCYNIVDANITWNKASMICKENDGHLITIETVEEQQFIAGQVQKRNFTAIAVWIGLKNVRGEDGRTWVNLEKVSYENWAKGEPNSPPVDENCAEINTTNFKWNDRPCTRHGGYICEKPVLISDGSKPCRTVGNMLHCYQIVQDEIQWTQAFSICSQDGGMLVTIESEAEQKFIEDQMQRIKFTVAALWIGANKLHPENQRTWVNGQQFTYVNWAEGEPNNNRYSENCAELSTSDCTWNDEMCSSERGYICKNTNYITSFLPGVIIAVVVVSVVILLSVPLVCCLMKKRRKNQKKKRAETYQGIHEMETRNAEHVYNTHNDLSDTYCTIDDYSSRPDDLTHRKEIYNN